MGAAEITAYFGGAALIIGSVGKVLLEKRSSVLNENKELLKENTSLKKKNKALEASNTRLKKLLK